MEKPTVCPHCGEEITKDNFANDALLRQFCETEACKKVEKKADLWFFSGVSLIIVTILTVIFYEPEPSLNGLIIVFCGAVVGFVTMLIGRRHEVMRDKLFQEFKKLQK